MTIKECEVEIKEWYALKSSRLSHMARCGNQYMFLPCARLNLPYRAAYHRARQRLGLGEKGMPLCSSLQDISAQKATHTLDPGRLLTRSS